jgi:hypothetical protein
VLQLVRLLRLFLLALLEQGMLLEELLPLAQLVLEAR